MKKLISSLLCFSLLITMPGCVPYRELKELSIVQGIGIDILPGGDFKMTFQIFKPQSGGGQEKQSASQDSEIVQAAGTTIFDAIRNATLLVGRKLYFSNARVYIIGEEACKNSLPKILDYFERNHEIQPTERLIVAKGTAESILTAKQNDKPIPTQKIQEILQNYTSSSKINDLKLIDIYQIVTKGISDLALPAIEVSKNSIGDILVMNGTAVFKKQQLVGYIDPTQTRGLLFVINKVKSGIIPVYTKEGGYVSLEIAQSKTEISAEIKDGKPTVTLKVKLMSQLTEAESAKIKVSDLKTQESLENLQNEEVKKEMTDVLNKVAKDYNADIFKIGNILLEKKPDDWRKVSKDWYKYLKNINYKIEVQSKIEQIGVITY